MCVCALKKFAHSALEAYETEKLASKGQMVGEKAEWAAALAVVVSVKAAAMAR